MQYSQPSGRSRTNFKDQGCLGFFHDRPEFPATSVRQVKQGQEIQEDPGLERTLENSKGHFAAIDDGRDHVATKV